MARPWKTISQLRRKTSNPRTRIQQLREQANLGLNETADHAGVSHSTLSRIEAGRAPDICSALRIARFFETSVEDLFGAFEDRARTRKSQRGDGEHE